MIRTNPGSGKTTHIIKQTQALNLTVTVKIRKKQAPLIWAYGLLLRIAVRLKLTDPNVAVRNYGNFALDRMYYRVGREWKKFGDTLRMNVLSEVPRKPGGTQSPNHGR